MFKNLIYGLLAAVMLLATSCIYDDIDTPEMAEEVHVSFALGLEGTLATRAISDGTGADKLVYAVYKVDEQDTYQKVISSVVENIESFVENGYTLPIPLAKGQSYFAAFWAQNGDCTAYVTDDLTNVQVNYDSASNNDETRDAFCARTEVFVAEDGQTVDVTLKRPFAQVNVGVTQEDWDAAVASGYLVKNSSAVITKAATSLNILTGEVGSDEDDVVVTYSAADIPEETLAVDTDGDGVKEPFVWLSMSYILVADHSGVAPLGTKSTTESMSFVFTPESGTEITLTDGLSNVPVQRNWRTNIVGRILTGETNFNITIDPEFENDNYVEYPNSFEQVADGVKTKKGEDGVYYIENPKGFDWLNEQLNVAENNGFEGVTVMLLNDIDFYKGVREDEEPITTPPVGSTGERDERNRLICKPFKGTFDGQGYTVKRMYQSGWDMGYDYDNYGSVGLFSELEGATVKNLVIEDMAARIERGDVAFIAGSATGNCLFENIEIKSGSVRTFDNGNGSIIGWSGPGNYTFRNIKIGSDVVLAGMWGSFDQSCGGIVGQAEPGASYNFDNVEINCRLDVFNDVTASWQHYLYRMCGMIVGRCAETIVIDGRNYPDLSQYNFTFKDVTVNFGDWMNYHYCLGPYGMKNTGGRVEPGIEYGGLDINAEDHEETCTEHMIWLPFTALIGGDQIGVNPITGGLEGVTVNYPDSYLQLLEEEARREAEAESGEEQTPIE